jgi:hypothetical protein
VNRTPEVRKLSSQDNEKKKPPHQQQPNPHQKKCPNESRQNQPQESAERRRQTVEKNTMFRNKQTQRPPEFNELTAREKRAFSPEIR